MSFWFGSIRNRSDIPIFARAVPQKIEINETYFYQADLPNHFVRPKQVDNKDKPSEGKVRVVVPYDGEKYFTQITLDDINRQNARIWAAATANVRIGYLGFSNFGRTDLGNRLNLGANHNVTPLHLPVTHPDLPPIRDGSEANVLLNDQRLAQINYAYAPRLAAITPISLEIKSYDEEQLAEFRHSLDKFFRRLDAKRPISTTKQQQHVVTHLTQLDSFKSGLVFDIQVKLQLPRGIGKEKDEKPPTLDQLVLKWPVTVAPEQVCLELVAKKHHEAGEKNESVIFDPTYEANGALSWSKIPFRAKGKSDKTDLFEYTTPIMRLHIKQPAELYRYEQLDGQLKVKIGGTMSGLDIQSFGADGQSTEPEVKKESQLQLDFKLSLVSFAQAKLHSPYRHSYHEGVVLNETRISDIRNILNNIGITSRFEKLTDVGKEYYLIRGEQPWGLDTLSLWVLCEGIPSYTVRQTEIPGNQSYTTPLKTGHTKIYMRGQLTGDSSRLLTVMNDLDYRLKELFYAVKTID